MFAKRRNVFTVLTILAAGLLVLAGCDNPTSSDGGGTDSVVQVDPDYNFQPDPDDTTPLEVLDGVPADGSSNVAPGSTLIFYFDDIVDPSTINSQTFAVVEGSAGAGASGVSASAAGDPIYGTINVSKSQNGQAAIISFSPFAGLPANSAVTATLSGSALLDDGGNPTGTDEVFSFETGAAQTTNISALGFEQGLTQFNVAGNTGVVSTPIWGISSIEGSNAAVITTGSVSTTGVTGTAEESQYSTITTGQIEVPDDGSTVVAVDYYFISDEFTDYIGSSFDDNARLSVSGPGGARSVELASVNEFTVGGVTLISDFPNDGEGDGDFYRGNADTAFVDISGLGSPVSISVTISDVGDSIFTSVLLFDNLRFE